MQTARDHFPARSVFTSNHEAASRCGRRCNLLHHFAHRRRLAVQVTLDRVIEVGPRLQRTGVVRFALESPSDPSAVEGLGEDVRHACQHRLGRQVGTGGIDNGEGEDTRAGSLNLSNVMDRGTAGKIDDDGVVGLLQPEEQVGYAISPVNVQAGGLE
jgi:hypothetical protein